MLRENNCGGKIFLVLKKILSKKYFLATKIISGIWQLTVGRWQVVVSRWQVECGMWPNCLGTVRKAGIRCSHQLVVGGMGNPDIAGAGAAGGLLSTFSVLI